MVVAEDRWFPLHPGVNPLSIARAVWMNLRGGRVVSGGSTIPMQIARMAEPRARTARAKLLEAFRALQLERRFSKIPLLARAAPSVGRLWWYQDGELLAAGRPGAGIFVTPARGSHRLVVVDDSGRSDGIDYRVE
ncbi:MAG: transglycosylase domain-containing protein [Candidatus Binatia bacterium]